jgi:3-dehydrosphinganine reductase
MWKKNRKFGTVYITGGSSGIGRAAAIRFAAAGSRVVVIGRNEERLRNTTAELVERSGGVNAHGYAAVDVSDRGKLERVVPELVARFGPPDLLLNAAGAAYPQYFEAVPYEKFREQLSVNLEGTWNMTQLTVPYMKTRGGTIVNVSSIAGFIGLFGYTAYSAAKFGVIGLSEALRNELGPDGIRVAVLCPPDTDTPGFAEENLIKPFETKAMSANLKVATAESVVGALLRGLDRNRFLIVPGADGMLSLIVKRLVPSLVFRILDRDLDRARALKNRARTGSEAPVGHIRER